MSSGESFPITDHATEGMRALIEVMQQGNAVSADTMNRFKDLRAEVMQQQRAFNTLSVQWKSNNMDLYAFSRTMSSVGAIGQTLLSTMNSIMLSQIAWASTTQQLSQAHANAKTSFAEWQAAVNTWGPTSREAIDAHNSYISALNNETSAQAQAGQQAVQMNVLYGSTVLSLGSVVSEVITATANFSRFVTVLQATTSAMTALAATTAGIMGAVTAAAALGAGFGALAGIMGDVAIKGMSVSLAIQDVSNKLGSIPLVGPVLGAMADAVGLVFQSFYDLGQQVRESMDTLWNATNDAGLKVRSTLLGAWSVIVDDANRAWVVLSSGWDSLWQGAQAILAPIWGGIVAAIKAGINEAINMVNGLIAAWDFAANSINSNPMAASVGIHIPTFPMLPHLAMGGIVNEPTLAVIGEKGPEAIVPLSGGPQIGGATGQTVIVNFYIAGSVTSENDLAELIDRKLYLTLQRIRS